MLQIAVITLFPEMFAALDASITGKAQQKGLLKIILINPRDFTSDKHKTVDDKPYGGGPGMLMKVEPLRKAIHAAKQQLGSDTKVIYLSPQGQTFDHDKAHKLNLSSKFILLCGRYEGIDERLLQTDIDFELSIGDYVLSGGEIAAMVVIDCCARLQPNALGDDESAQNDSFCHGILDFPQYTRPETIAEHPVPDVLLRGDHKAIKRWREKHALGATWLKRPDLLKPLNLSKEQQTLLQEFINEQGHNSDE